MAEKEAADQFDEERRSARRENDFVRQIRAKTDLSDAGKALKLYDKLIRENYFKTMVGYAFLEELRDIIIRGGSRPGGGSGGDSREGTGGAGRGASDSGAAGSV